MNPELGIEGWKLLAREEGVLLYQSRNRHHGQTIQVLSSAVLNGGLRSFTTSSDHDTNGGRVQVFNGKVPLDYDGFTPDPVELVKNLARQQQQEQGAAALDEESVMMIGMLTAASMTTLRTATQRASCNDDNDETKKDVIVDAIVTAGISNARAAGAPADFFSVASSNNSTTAAGTINTIVLVNANLDEAALIEAYTVAIEAKCAACANLGILCAKTAETAQGTGTDCTVFMSVVEGGNKSKHLYAGKHTLLGELVGQAVYQATRKALLSNLEYFHGKKCAIILYRFACWKQKLVQALQQGHRPVVPSQPMEPVPGPSWLAVVVGWTGVVLAFWMFAVGDNSPSFFVTANRLSALKPSVSVVLAAMVYDRFLGALPLVVHPVVLTGKLISFFLRLIPEPVYRNPVLGLVAGCGLWIMTMTVSLSVSWCVLWLSDEASARIATVAAASLATASYEHWVRVACGFAAWMVEVFLVSSSLSLQLLCTIALQMAYFLERRQLAMARAQLSWLCSRDASSLQTDELSGATLESLAENLSDSLVSTLVWYAVFGPLGAIGFRVINTLDSRVGYRGGRFEWVGKLSARCDDLLNILPARLTALLFVVSTLAISGCQSAWKGVSVAWSDAAQCDSPNAGWPMAAMAGILNVRLEKRGGYCLGARGKPPGPGDIRIGYRIAQLAGGLAMLLSVIIISYLHGLG